jgi:hypothetical protein
LHLQINGSKAKRAARQKLLLFGKGKAVAVLQLSTTP